MRVSRGWGIGQKPYKETAEEESEGKVDVCRVLQVGHRAGVADAQRCGGWKERRPEKCVGQVARDLK